MPTKSVFSYLKFWIPVLFCMAIIFYLSSIPGKDVPPLFPYQDIVYHFGIYFLLAFFFARALLNSYPASSVTKILVFTVVFAFIYGISDELHQSFVPGRSVAGLDVFIDSIGGASGALLFKWLL